MAGEGSKKTQFQKGGSGNPKGRMQMPEPIKQAQRMDKITFATLLHKFMHMDRELIMERLKDPKATMIELIVAKIVSESFNKADHMRLNFLLDRLIGKVKDEVEITGAKPMVINLLNNAGQIILGDERDAIDSRSIEQLPEVSGLRTVNKTSKTSGSMGS